MYTNFYHLNRKPFQISSDPAFMWLGEKHKEALATLKYGILDNKGFLLLTGDVRHRQNDFDQRSSPKPK